MNKFIHNAIRNSLLVLVFVLSSCGGGSSTPSVSITTGSTPTAAITPGSTPTAAITPGSTPTAATTPGSTPTAATTTLATISFTQVDSIIEYKVNKPGNSLDKFGIYVEPNTFSEPGTITITATANPPAPLRPEAVAAGMGIVSPTFELKHSGSDVFPRPLFVTLPYDKILSPEVPTVLYFNHSTARYEGVEVIAVNKVAGTITFATRHFSHYVVSGSIGTKPYLSSVDVGFNPQRDEFGIKNFNTVQSPSGSCFGMAAYTKWYFENKYKSSLIGLKDFSSNGTENNYDDDFAYNIASLVQEHQTGAITTGPLIGGTGFINLISNNIGIFDDFPLSARESKGLELAHFRLRLPDFMGGNTEPNLWIKSAVMQLQSTQNLVLISAELLNNKNGSVAGYHSVVAYRFDGKYLYIYDGNFPAKCSPSVCAELAIPYDIKTDTFSQPVYLNDPAGLNAPYSSSNYIWSKIIQINEDMFAKLANTIPADSAVAEAQKLGGIRYFDGPLGKISLDNFSLGKKPDSAEMDLCLVGGSGLCNLSGTTLAAPSVGVRYFYPGIATGLSQPTQTSANSFLQTYNFGFDSSIWKAADATLFQFDLNRILYSTRAVKLTPARLTFDIKKVAEQLPSSASAFSTRNVEWDVAFKAGDDEKASILATGSLFANLRASLLLTNQSTLSSKIYSYGEKIPLNPGESYLAKVAVNEQPAVTSALGVGIGKSVLNTQAPSTGFTFDYPLNFNAVVGPAVMSTCPGGTGGRTFTGSMTRALGSSYKLSIDGVSYSSLVTIDVPQTYNAANANLSRNDVTLQFNADNSISGYIDFVVRSNGCAGRQYIMAGSRVTAGTPTISALKYEN